MATNYAPRSQHNPMTQRPGNENPTTRKTSGRIQEGYSPFRGTSGCRPATERRGRQAHRAIGARTRRPPERAATPLGWGGGERLRSLRPPAMAWGARQGPPSERSEGDGWDLLVTFLGLKWHNGCSYNINQKLSIRNYIYIYNGNIIYVYYYTVFILYT